MKVVIITVDGQGYPNFKLVAETAGEEAILEAVNTGYEATAANLTLLSREVSGERTTSLTIGKTV